MLECFSKLLHFVSHFIKNISLCFSIHHKWSIFSVFAISNKIEKIFVRLIRSLISGRWAKGNLKSIFFKIKHVIVATIPTSYVSEYSIEALQYTYMRSDLPLIKYLYQKKLA